MVDWVVGWEEIGVAVEWGMMAQLEADWLAGAVRWAVRWWVTGRNYSESLSLGLIVVWRLVSMLYSQVDYHD